MTKRKRGADGTFTGVAGGGLGTAANLEDTQLYQVEDLQPEPAPEPAPAPVRAPPPARSNQVLPPAPIPVAAPRPAPVVGHTRSRSVPGGAIAAAILIAVVGGAVLLAAAGGEPKAGSGI